MHCKAKDIFRLSAVAVAVFGKKKSLGWCDYATFPDTMTRSLAIQQRGIF